MDQHQKGRVGVGRQKLTEEGVSHPLADNDVDLVDWEADFFDLAMNECDLAFKAAVLDNLLGRVDNPTAVDAVHMLCPRLETR